VHSIDYLHGREAEEKVIGDLLRRARQGVGAVVLVEGEPGIGKSLLLKNATDEAAAQCFSLVTGAADRLDQAIPFAALRTALPEQISGSLTRSRAHLERRAAAGPVLVCFDDLHWADPATLAVLRVLARDLRTRPVAWLLSRMSSAQGAAEHMFCLLEKDGASKMALAALDQDAVSAMVADAFGAPPGPELAGLARAAAGNPSLVAELIAGLREDRAVRVTGGLAMLESGRLPTRIHRVARQRLDGLSRQARRLLVTAAVLGPAFRLEDAADMLGETPAMLLPAVEESMDAAIMTAAEHTFAFRHQLLRRAVGEMIPRPARTALHRQYGEILLSRGETTGRAASHLLRAAHTGDRAAVVSLDRAAEQTLRSAPRVAADLAVRALELTSPADPAAISRAVAAAEALTAAGRLDQAAELADGMLAKPLPPAAEDRLRCALSTVLCDRGQAADAASLAARVLARPLLPADVRDRALTARLRALTALRTADIVPAADPVTAADPVAAPGRYGRDVAAAALVARSAVAWDEGRIGAALDLLRDAARLDAAASPDARHVQPLLALAAALIDLRETSEAEIVLGAAGQPALDGIPAQAGLSILRGRLHLAAGRLAEAAADGQAALATATDLGAAGYAATAHSLLAMIELRRGEISAAAQHIADRGPAGPQFADLYARTDSVAGQMLVTEAEEGLAGAFDQVRRLCADLESRPGLLAGDPALAAWLARAALAAEDTDLAARVARVARGLADAHPGFAALTAAAAHSGGLTWRDPARLAEAAARHPDPWARASAAEDLGVLCREQNDRDQAIAHLKEALGGYSQVGADRDQARVRRRLRQLGIRRRHWSTAASRPVTGWDSLTRTEQSVAHFVAEGLNNGQVAARMYISPHTVAHHLRQAFRKLGIASRVELTRIVIENSRKGTSE
jgi:DNA-binding CsgD family transcriptional regulator